MCSTAGVVPVEWRAKQPQQGGEQTPGVHGRPLAPQCCRVDVTCARTSGAASMLPGSWQLPTGLLPHNRDRGTTGPIPPGYWQLINCHLSHSPGEASAPTNQSLLLLGFRGLRDIPSPPAPAGPIAENQAGTSRIGCARAWPHATGW